MSDSLDRAIGRIEGRVEMVLGKIDVVLSQQAVQTEALDKVAQRTAALERWQSKMVGAAAVAGVIGGAVAKALL